MAAENLGTLTADLVANTGGFEKGMDRAQRALKATAREAAYQGTQLEKLVGQIDPVTGALSKLDKQQQQLDAHFKAGRLPLDDYREFSKILDQQKTTAANSVVGFQKLDKQMAANGQTLKQYQNNLRGVPAQFTDIFTSLQGGQAPLTVLIQQGGQLKDMFGGVGAAGKALGGYVLGLVNPFTVAAAAAVALGVAYAKGSAESTAFNTALAATGNFAGTSSDSLASMAAQIAQTTGTVGAAAEVLAQLAGSGKIAVGSFDEIAIAALKTQAATGQAASEIVANFVKIAEDPLKAVIKLNEGMNFLSETIYSQIKAFQDQGDAASAAALANTAYADALNGVADKVSENLGYIESAWKIVKGAAKDAWDAMLNVGRDTTLDSAIEEAQKLVNTLAEAKKINNSRGSGGALAPDNSIRETEAQQRLTDLLVQRDEKNRREASARIAAQQKADALGAAQDIDKIHEGLASKDEQRDKARAVYLQKIDKLQAGVKNGTVQGDDPRLNAERIAADLDAIDEKYKEKKVKRDKAYVEDAGVRALDQAKQQYAVLEQQSQQLDEQTGKLKAMGPAQQELIKWEQELADIKTKQTLTAAQKSLLATADQITAQKALNANLEAETESRKANAEQAKQLAEFTQAQSDAMSRFQQGLDNQVAGVGLGSEGRKRLQDDLALQNDYANQVDRLRRDKLSGKITQDTYDKETAILKANLGEQLAAYQNNYAKIEAARGQWQNGMSAALQDYLYDVQDVAGQTYTLFSNSFKGLEDSLVDFISTGKLSFKSLADSILADIARIIVRTQILGPILSSLGMGGSTTGSGVSGAISSVLGAGSGGGLGGILGSIKSVVSVAGSSFGKAVISGFNSGDGIVGGLQGAFTNGADYVSSAITSAFASGSATATQVAGNFAASATPATVDLINNSVSVGGQTIGTASGFTSSAAASNLSALSATLQYIGVVYNVISSFKDFGAKGAATTAGFTAAGAAIGSVVPVIGTLAGAVIGSALGSFASSKLFGGSGEKYPDLSTSATGRYINGQYTDTGAATTWQRNAPKYGSAADAAMSSTLNKFSMTLGNLYEVLGNGADVVAYSTLQQRKTSGKYSSTFGAQLDDGSVITAKQQFKAADISAALTADYDDIMGTFLAKAIVSSKSLPDYFKAQFTEFANSWDTTADEVIKAIEGVFTRFNGVNDALSLININNLKLDDTGLQASDAILNMVGSMSDLDLATASAKDKVDALNTAVTAYYQAFFTADEQLADLKKSLQGAFGNFGLQLPDTRAAYRAMVEDIDVTTAAGQAMFATLVGLATNADSYYDNLEQTAKAASDAAAQAAADAAQAAADAAQAASEAAQQAIADANAALLKASNDSFSKLQRSITAQQKELEDAYNARVSSLNDMLDTANAKVSDLKGVSDDLGSALKSLRGDSDDAVKMLRAQAQATLQSALSIAKAGGSLTGVSGLSDALDTVGSNSTSLYASLEDFNRDQGRTAAVVAELNAINGKQLTNAEKTVANLEAQLDQAKKSYDAQVAALNAQLALGQSQIDAINGVDTSVTDVASAIREMNVAFLAALGGKGNSTENTWAGNAGVVHSAYQTAFGRDVDEQGLRFWTDALQSGAVTYDTLIAELVKAGRANGESIKVPGYATGGRASGLFWTGENGPEIVATGSAQVYSAAQTKAIMSGDGGDSSSDKEWKEQVNAALYAIAKNTMKTAKNTDLIPQKLQEELDL